MLWQVHYLSYSSHFDDLQPLDGLFDRCGRNMKCDDIVVGETVFVKWGGSSELYEVRNIVRLVMRVFDSSTQARVCEVTLPSSGAHAVRVRYDDLDWDWDQWVSAQRIIRKLPRGVI